MKASLGAIARKKSAEVIQPSRTNVLCSGWIRSAVTVKW